MQNTYETDDLLNQYLGFHYGDTYFDVENYAVRCAALCLQFMGESPRRVALDLGCAVGRSAFELAKGFDSVVAVDLSQRFIDAACRLQAGDTLTYWQQDEGQIGQYRTACLQQTDMWAHAHQVRFVQGDACVKATDEPLADLVFAGNLIDRVNDPAAFLKGLAHRVRPGGMLVISSPYTLLPDYTPPENWIGGLMKDGRPQTTLDGMTRLLQPSFTPAAPPLDVPFVIRETARKFQHTVAQMTVWKRTTH